MADAGRRVLNVFAKCSDNCHVRFKEDGAQLGESTGYVPHGIGIGGGDYINFRIDADTGQILNWKPINNAGYLLALEGE